MKSKRGKSKAIEREREREREIIKLCNRSNFSLSLLTSIYPTPLPQDMTQGQFLSKAGLNSEFSFFYTGRLNKVNTYRVP